MNERVLVISMSFESVRDVVTGIQDVIGYILTAIGIAVILLSGPFTFVSDVPELARTTLYYAFGGSLIFFAGVIMNPKTYENISIDGFKERSPRAIWAALALTSFAVVMIEKGLEMTYQSSPF